MKNTELLNEHNMIELLKNALLIAGLTRNGKDKGLRHIASENANSLVALCDELGINVEQAEAELAEEMNTLAKSGIGKAMDVYFRNINNRTGISREEFNRRVAGC